MRGGVDMPAWQADVCVPGLRGSVDMQNDKRKYVCKECEGAKTSVQGVRGGSDMTAWQAETSVQGVRGSVDMPAWQGEA